jgi:hypothetical protein
MFARLYVGVDISLTSGKYVHDHIISVRRKVWAHTVSLNLSLYPSPLLLEHFQNLIEKLQKEAKSIPLIHKYMTTHFIVFVHTLQLKVMGTGTGLN